MSRKVGPDSAAQVNINLEKGDRSWKTRYMDLNETKKTPGMLLDDLTKA